jgi:hypothetical protein
MRMKISIIELKNKNPPYPPKTAIGGILVHSLDLITNGRTMQHMKNRQN